MHVKYFVNEYPHPFHVFCISAQEATPMIYHCKFHDAVQIQGIIVPMKSHTHYFPSAWKSEKLSFIIHKLRCSALKWVYNKNKVWIKYVEDFANIIDRNNGIPYVYVESW